MPPFQMLAANILKISQRSRTRIVAIAFLETQLRAPNLEENVLPPSLALGMWVNASGVWAAGRLKDSLTWRSYGEIIPSVETRLGIEVKS
jgi:hypothetical protein